MSKPINTGGEGKASLLAKPVRDTTREELDAMFLRAAKPPEAWLIGLELELFGFHRADRSPVEHATLAKVLDYLGRRASMKQEHDDSGALIGLEGDGMVISLEPGGQIELATRPYSSLQELRTELNGYADALRVAGDEVDIGFWAIGYHPYRDHRSMPHMPKERYEIMRAYFGGRGPRALDMMHLTASVQCAVDFSDERDMTNKIRTAARVSPFFSALVAASPFAGGKLNGFKTIRYQVWLEMDDDRAGIWPEMLDAEGLTFRRYVERAMRMPVLFFKRDGKHLRAEPKPFAHFAEHGFAGTQVTVADLLDHLTTFFPEIRPKAYVELRGADCVPPVEAVAVAGFWRAILDDEAARQEIEARLAPMGYAELRALQPLVAKLGLSAMSPIGPVSEIAQWLVELAYARQQATSPSCAECLEPLVERARSGRSPADDMLERAERTSIDDAVAACAL